MRVTHTPTGVFAVARGRSFDHSLRLATQVVAAKVRAAETAPLRADPRVLVRRYALHPSERVCDVRSGYTTGAVRDVLNGDLDALLDASRRAIPVPHEQPR